MKRVVLPIVLLTFTFLQLFMCTCMGQACNRHNDSIKTYVCGAKSISFYCDGHYEMRDNGFDLDMAPPVPTISYGHYIKYKNLAYYLFSDSLYESGTPIYLNGEESIGSLTEYRITIKDTFQTKHQMYNIDAVTGKEIIAKRYYYNVRLYYDCAAIYNARVSDSTLNLFKMGLHYGDGTFYYETTTYDNEIIIPKILFVPIESIEIVMIPFFSSSQTITLYYKVHNHQSNSFVLEIPATSYLKLNGIELFGEIAEIINNYAIDLQNKVWTTDKIKAWKMINRNCGSKRTQIWKYRYKMNL